MKRHPQWLIVPLLVILGACEQSHLPATNLFVDIEGKTYSEGTRLIQSRLQARFPTGSPESKLEEYLDDQGLEVEHAACSSHAICGVATFKYGGSFCGSQILVNWSSDVAGKINPEP